jgi:hypothetical protein
MKNKTIEYTKDYVFEEGIIIPIQAYSSVVSNHTKRYHNCLYLLANLGTCARNLMDYLVEQMTPDNIVYSNKHTRDSFRELISQISETNIDYSDSSIKKAFNELSSKGLIRPLERGVFKVNPMYFIKNGDEDRLEMIKVELEFKEDLDTKLSIIKFKHKEELSNVQPYIEKYEISNK